MRNHAEWLSGVGRDTEAWPVYQEARTPQGELAEHHRVRVLLDQIRAFGTFALASIEGGSYDAAVAALVRALSIGQQLPEDTRLALRPIVGHLHRAYTASPEEVSTVFRQETGEDLTGYLAAWPIEK